VTTPNPSQSGAAGGSFTFALSASGFSTTPTYTASCTIPEGTCTVSGSTLTVTTTALAARTTHEAALAGWPGGGTPHTGELQPVPLNARCAVLATTIALFAAFALWLGAGPQRRRTRFAAAPLAAFAMVVGLAFLAACGGGGGGGGGQTGTPPGTYTVKITATAGTQSATTTVSVTVQ
jgi:hypothetical protein